VLADIVTVEAARPTPVPVTVITGKVWVALQQPLFPATVYRMY